MANKVTYRKVFVYGTLKQGHHNHHCLDGAEYLGKAITTDSVYTMIDLGAYPGVLLNGENTIQGELYEINDEIESRLDRLEGYPTLYDKCSVTTNEGVAMMYYYPRWNLRSKRKVVVKGGVWK